MHLILTGATGFVGSAVLHHMINAPAITRVSVLSRRPVPQAEGHEKVKVIILKDFSTYPSEILEKLRGAEGCVWAQGISVTQVSKEEYVKITYDYALTAARAFTSLPTLPTKLFKFVYVSGEGATTTPAMFTQYFGLVKGRTEAALLALSKDAQYANLKPYSLRPGGVDTRFHSEIHGFLPRRPMVQRLSEAVTFPLFRTFWSSMVSPTKDLARVLTDLASSDGEALSGVGVDGDGRTVSNIGMRRLAGI